ncbi:MAG: hypothetical protein DRP93_01270 [Candidatus Neomarinimicrobiota bacterium]|nr:MAG: hypothetical protein DRP93_01270 [Candidatus Neomarinimicrobiota bacterium]
MIRNLSVEDYAQTIIASEYKWSMGLETFYQAIESYETLGGLILLDGRIDLIKPFLEEGALLGKYEDLTPAEVFGKTMEELTTIITEYKGLLGK